MTALSQLHVNNFQDLLIRLRKNNNHYQTESHEYDVNSNLLARVMLRRKRSGTIKNSFSEKLAVNIYLNTIVVAKVNTLVTLRDAASFVSIIATRCVLIYLIRNYINDFIF